jgi:hypothetical protein
VSDRLNDLLQALRGATLDRPLDQLEPMVWGRIEARRGAAAPMGFRLQLAAAGAALAMGLALGWTMTSQTQAAEGTSLLYASYAEVGPIGRLEGGL